MTIEEAIEIIEKRYMDMFKCDDFEKCVRNNQAIRMAIEALKDKQRMEDDGK